MSLNNEELPTAAQWGTSPINGTTFQYTNLDILEEKDELVRRKDVERLIKDKIENVKHSRSIEKMTQAETVINTDEGYKTETQIFEEAADKIREELLEEVQTNEEKN